MTLTSIALLILIIVATIVLIILLQLKNRTGGHELNEVLFKLNNIPIEINRIETGVKEEIALNRREMSEISRNSRDELSSSLARFGELIGNSMKDSSKKIKKNN